LTSRKKTKTKARATVRPESKEISYHIGIVLEGKIKLVIDGEQHCFTKGDRYHIPEGVRLSGKIYAGYSDITYFNETNRYSIK